MYADVSDTFSFPLFFAFSNSSLSFCIPIFEGDICVPVVVGAAGFGLSILFLTGCFGDAGIVGDANGCFDDDEVDAWGLGFVLGFGFESVWVSQVFAFLHVIYTCLFYAVSV